MLVDRQLSELEVFRVVRGRVHAPALHLAQFVLGDLAVVDEVDLAVDVHVVDLRDVLGDEEERRVRPDGIATTVRRSRVLDDVALARQDDVEVVEVIVGVHDEGADRPRPDAPGDVVRDVDGDRGADAGRVAQDRVPAPQRVERVQDQDVSAAGGHEPGVADDAAAVDRLLTGRQNSNGRPRAQVHPVYGVDRVVDDVGRAIRPEDEAGQIIRGECDHDLRLHDRGVEVAVEPGDDLGARVGQ